MYIVLRWCERIVLGITVLALCLAGALWYSPYRLLRVQSNSMQPLFVRGDAVLVDTRHRQPRLGTVVAYRNVMGINVTHRVVHIDPKGLLVTQGDALSQPDTAIQPSRILGRVTLVILGLGLLLDFIHTPLGFGLLVIGPSALILFVEMNEIIRMLQLKIYRARPGY